LRLALVAAALCCAAVLPGTAAAQAADARASADDAGTRCLETAISDPQGALRAASAGLAQARAAVDHKAEARFLHCEGYAREQLGDTSLALARYTDAVAAAQLSGDDGVMAAALVSRGEMRHFNGDYGDAISDLTRAFELNEELGNENGTSYALNAIANLYADANVGEYDKAIDYYQRTLERHRKLGKRGEMATALFNIGSTQERKGDFASALSQYEKALEIDSSLDNGEGKAEEERVIGGVLVKLARAREALPHIDRSLAWFRDNNDPDGVARVRLTRGIALRGAGRAADALADLDASREYFLKEANQRFLVRIAEERAKAYADLQQWQPAYEALGEQFAAQRLIDRQLAEERTSRLRVQFDTEQTEKQNTRLQEENQRRAQEIGSLEREKSLQAKVYVLVGLLVALLCLLVLLVSRTRRRKVDAAA
jgi:tetratricopeptide (TPR) repeat protein